jgi:hypothetical protein
MYVIGCLVKRLSCDERLWLTTRNLHNDCAFENVYKGMRVVPVTRRCHTGRIFDFQYDSLAAFDIRQICPEQRGYEGLLGRTSC